MARILLVEKDAVFAAVLEDRLHVAGHKVMRQEEYIAGAMTEQVDLMLLDIGDALAPGLETIRVWRQQPDTRSVPVVLLTGALGSSERVAVLRAGADDVVAKPCDPEEVLLRIDRLLGTRTAPVLEGDLDSHPLWELLEYARSAGKSGRLTVQGRSGSGQLRLLRGQAIDARWQGLAGHEAVLTLLGIKEGRFRFEVEEKETVGIPDGANALPIHQMLMQAAWLQDELEKRRTFLPATGVPLRVTRDTFPAVDPIFEPLPLQRVFERVRKVPGTRLFDLLADEAEAATKTRLAVAILGEDRVLVAAEEDDGQEFPTTTEISSSLMLDLALTQLVIAARQAGVGSSALPYLLLLEADVWPALRTLLVGSPDFHRNEQLRKLVDQLELRWAGSAIFQTERGKLSLHVQVLRESVQTQIRGIVPVCAGVLVWLSRGDVPDLLSSVIERLHESATGVLVADSLAAREAVLQLTEEAPRWQISAHAPRSLLGVLRLLHPKQSR